MCQLMVENGKPPVAARLLREAGHGVATASGGPFRTPHVMEWQLTDASGAVLGVVGSESLALWINRLAELYQLLIEVDAKQHLRQRYDMGHLEIPAEMLARLERLLTRR